MDYQEARGVLVEEIRKRTAVPLLMDALEAADRAQAFLTTFEAKKVELNRAIAELETQKEAGVADAKRAAEHAARQVTADWERQISAAQKRLEAVHNSITEYENIKVERQQDVANIARDIEQVNADKHRLVMQWEVKIAEHKATAEAVEKEIAHARERQTILHARWEEERQQAEERLAVVKQEMAALLAKLG